MNKTMKYKVYRDRIEEESSTPIQVTRTLDGHTVETYTVNGKPRHFVTIKNSYLCAHGNTVAEAVADALWKDPKNRPSREALVKEIQKEGPNRLISLQEFRHLTGACRTGCMEAIKKAGVSGEPMTAYDIRDKVNKEWGDQLLNILNWR